MKQNNLLRKQLKKILDWKDAHMNFDTAVKGIPVKLRGIQPEGLPYSLWQIIEHMRLSQLDILDFCRNPDYKEKEWPREYWPPDAEPPTDNSWDESIAGFRSDLETLKNLAEDPKLDLFAAIPHGTGQTYLRELLLNADHNAYHIGQLLVLRRLLGIWKE